MSKGRMHKRKKTQAAEKRLTPVFWKEHSEHAQGATLDDGAPEEILCNICAPIGMDGGVIHCQDFVVPEPSTANQILCESNKGVRIAIFTPNCPCNWMAIMRVR